MYGWIWTLRPIILPCFLSWPNMFLKIFPIPKRRWCRPIHSYGSPRNSPYPFFEPHSYYIFGKYLNDPKCAIETYYWWSFQTRNPQVTMVVSIHFSGLVTWMIRRFGCTPILRNLHIEIYSVFFHQNHKFIYIYSHIIITIQYHIPLVNTWIYLNFS